MVSIVIPTFNRSALLIEALESISKQSYKNLEVVIVDDASTDDTNKKIAEFSGLNIIYQKLEKNIGYIAARNKGIDLASGSYISFLDSDDRMLPDKIDFLVSEATKTNAAFVYAGWRWMNFDSSTVRVERIPDNKGEINGLPRWCYNVVPDLVKTNVMKNYGFNKEACNSENTEFLIRIFQSEKIAYVEKILSEYRDHDAPRESGNIKGILKGMEFIMHHHYLFAKSEIKWVAEKYLSMALLVKKINGGAKKRNLYFFKSFYHSPFKLRTWLHWMASLFI